MDLSRELKTLSQRIFEQSEIEITDLMLDNIEAQQTISDLEIDVMELKGE